MSKAAVVAVVVVLSLLFACGPPLSGAVTFGERCSERTCDDGSTCVDDARSSGEPYAACAVDTRPDPDCYRDSNRAFCDGNTFASCRGRYRVQSTPCGVDHCVEALNRAACVPVAEPDPSCDATERESVHCKGEVAVTCFGPYANDTKDCAVSGRFCRAGICVTNPIADPRCAALASGKTNFCDGNVAVQCAGAFHVEEHDCARGGLRCVDNGSFVTCK